MIEAPSAFFQQELANARKIRERIIIEGDLRLETPTRFGNGDREGLIDLTIARDPLTALPLLPGASIAGALRSYLRNRIIGYRNTQDIAELEELLFGYEKGSGGSQSYLVTYDSRAATLTTELRDGVAIDPKTRTARDQKKYDLELLAAGTTFPLRIELLVAADRQTELLQALAIALQGFERGEIPMGARRRRGFGRCRVQEWRMRRYNLTNGGDLVAWLQEDEVDARAREQRAPTIDELVRTLDGTIDTTVDRRQQIALDAIFGIASSLLIRAGAEDPAAPDMVHLHSKRDGQERPIISGASLAGALRGRALRIAQTVGVQAAAERYINDLFGPQIEGANDIPCASRLWVEESVIDNPREWVVSRVKIDRFTGGSYPTALFNQQPVFGVAETAVHLRLKVQSPTAADEGLLLLLLKDLWTEDLPLGGEASVGRGRLCGKWAALAHQTAADEPKWQIQQVEDRLRIDGDRVAMQRCVDAFRQQVGAPEEAPHA